MEFVRVSVYAEGYYSGQTYEEAVYITKDFYDMAKDSIDGISIYVYELDGKHSEVEGEVEVEVFDSSRDLELERIEIKNDDGERLWYQMEEIAKEHGVDLDENQDSVLEYLKTIDSYVDVSYRIKKSQVNLVDCLMTTVGMYDIKERGKITDGSHTFDELYYHRMILFAVICNNNRSLSWKSWKHEDDTMYDDYFIVGIQTPEGQFSYHYHKDHWDKFDVPEIDNAPAWDGHTSIDITRLLSL